VKLYYLPRSKAITFKFLNNSIQHQACCPIFFLQAQAQHEKVVLMIFKIYYYCTNIQSSKKCSQVIKLQHENTMKLFFSFEMRSCYIAQAGLKLMTFLSQPHESLGFQACATAAVSSMKLLK
jgi:hypothetical protein